MIFLAAGVASHGIFVELNWEIKPIVLMSFSGTVKKIENSNNFQYRCYPYEVSSKGFKVYARSIDCKTDCIVNWIAFNLKPPKKASSC
jgi:hypothetical protein